MAVGQSPFRQELIFEGHAMMRHGALTRAFESVRRSPRFERPVRYSSKGTAIFSHWTGNVTRSVVPPLEQAIRASRSLRIVRVSLSQAY